MAEIVSKVGEILKAEKEGCEVSPELWRSCKCFLKEDKDGSGRKVWVRDEQAVRNAGLFVIRSNVQPDPFEALMRNTVEQDFNQFRNRVDGVRLRCTGKTYSGRLLVCTIAASLRLMVLRRAKLNSAELKVKIPKDSLDVVMTVLRKIRAERRGDGNARIVRQLTKKQREMITLLGLANPPRTLR